MQPDALREQLQRAAAHQPVPNATRASRRLDRPAASRSSTACLNSATRVSSQSRWPRNMGELPAAASTGAVASWAAL